MTTVEANLAWRENSYCKGRSLRRLFEQLNTQFFRGRLRGWHVHSVNHFRAINLCGLCIPRNRRILIVRWLCEDEAKSVLLHEMAHAVTTTTHGVRWKREMIRLRQASAPLLPPDSNIQLGDDVESRCFFQQ